MLYRMVKVGYTLKPLYVEHVDKLFLKIYLFK
jgi:hypothetical protein